ncbi:MAG: hypothetical protein IPQ15_16705 [Betaproteobacteria bacterium]|nr:hypothetical protein [Betaproteobacteria bacterium]
MRLHPENETRPLPLQVTDYPGADLEVMRAIAHSARADFEPALWIALQQWIARGEHREGPARGSPALAERIPPIAVSACGGTSVNC